MRFTLLGIPVILLTACASSGKDWTTYDGNVNGEQHSLNSPVTDAVSPNESVAGQQEPMAGAPLQDASSANDRPASAPPDSH